jgi:hypothetical protein
MPFPYGSAAPPYEVHFQLLPWRLYFVTGKLTHRAPPELMGDEDSSQRVSYRWNVSTVAMFQALGLECPT